MGLKSVVVSLSGAPVYNCRLQASLFPEGFIARNIEIILKQA